MRQESYLKNSLQHCLFSLPRPPTVTERLHDVIRKICVKETVQEDDSAKNTIEVSSPAALLAVCLRNLDALIAVSIRSVSGELRRRSSRVWAVSFTA